MAADLKTATSAVTSTPVNTQLGTSEATIYASTNVGTKGVLKLTNTDTVSRTPLISQVKTGGSAGGAGTRIFARLLTAGESAYIPFTLGDGDFLSGKCTTAAVIDTVVDGVVFSSTSVGVAAGIQTDAIGTGGHGAGTVTGTNAVGTGANRYLFGALMVQPSTFVASYDTLSMSCTDGAMTALGHCDFNYGSGAIGSVYLFGRANPTSSLTQTLTGTAVKSGVTMVTVLGSMSKSGVASVTAAATDGPTTVSALSLAITSAVGHVPMFAGVFRDAPQDFNLRTRYFNGALNAGITVPQWLLLADAIGASTVTATTSNTSYHAAVGIDVVPA